MQLPVLLTPKAFKNQIEGWSTTAEGKPILKIKVTAIPESGKANTALIKLLSKELRLAKSKIAIVRGETSRQKLLEIEGKEETVFSSLSPK